MDPGGHPIDGSLASWEEVAAARDDWAALLLEGGTARLSRREPPFFFDSTTYPLGSTALAGPGPGVAVAVGMVASMPTQAVSRNVQPSKRLGGWEIVRAGSKRATAFDETKDGAVKKARAMVRREGGG